MVHSDDKFNDVCKLLLQSHINNLKIISDKIDNGGYYKPKINSATAVKTAPVVEAEEIYTLQEAYNIFDENLEASENQKDINQKYFKFIVKFLGNVKDLNDIKKTDFITYKAKLSKEKTAKKALLAVTTKRRYVNLANKFFEYLYDNNLMQILIKIGNFKEDKVEKHLSKKEVYSFEELEKWYKWALNVDNEEFKWITLLAIFNGLSTSEITRLEKHNIKKENDIWCVEVELTETKATKNINRIRTIPIHLELIKLGFLDYVDSCKSDLFQISNKAFSRKMTNVNRDFVTTNPKRTFHRIRASFINYLIQSGKVEKIEYIASLAGHSQEYGIGFESYAEDINVKLLSTALKVIDYKF